MELSTPAPVCQYEQHVCSKTSLTPLSDQTGQQVTTKRQLNRVFHSDSKTNGAFLASAETSIHASDEDDGQFYHLDSVVESFPVEAAVLEKVLQRDADLKPSRDFFVLVTSTFSFNERREKSHKNFALLAL